MYILKDGRVFWGGYEVKKVDLATFEILNPIWARDSSNLFSAGSRTRGVDPDDFVVLNRIFGRDSSRVFFFGGHAKKIVDPGSFEVLDEGVVDLERPEPTPLGYAKDNESVYFYEETFGAPRPLRGADPATFEVLSYGYGADATRVYCRGSRLSRADRGSFEVLGPHHGRDARHVFYADYLIPDADPETFEIVEGLCGKDSCRVYLRAEVIEGADPDSFRPMQGEFLARDRASVYFHGKVLDGVEPDRFEEIGRGYYRYQTEIYYRGKVLPGADVDTFEILPHLEPSEKRAYWRGELAAPEEAVSGFTAMDANKLYRFDFSMERTATRS